MRSNDPVKNGMFLFKKRVISLIQVDMKPLKKQTYLNLYQTWEALKWTLPEHEIQLVADSCGLDSFPAWHDEIEVVSLFDNVVGGHWDLRRYILYSVIYTYTYILI